MNILNSLTLVPAQTSQGQPGSARVTLDLGPFDQHNTVIRIETDLEGVNMSTGDILQTACRQAIAMLETIAKARRIPE